MSINVANNLTGKKILLVTYWGWPIFGGGEQYFYDSMKWCYEAGMVVTWICFAHSKPSDDNSFKKLNIITTPYGNIMQIPGGFEIENLKNWIKLLNPDIVHHQGNRRYEIVKACHELDIKIITGICFWNDIIDLNKDIGNINIIKNAEHHKEAEHFRDILTWADVVYSSSYFVTDVVKKITGIRINDVVYSSSLRENCKINDYNRESQIYVTVINCHKLKGGDILLECMKRLPNIPFMVIKTEYCSDELDNKIQKEISERNKYAMIESMFLERFDNIKDVFSKTKIFLGTTLVDETFGKTFNEAMCNGIPIITTGRGNVGYMVRDCAKIIEPNRIDDWVNEINRLYTDTNYYDHMSKKVLKRYESYSEEVASKQLTDVIEKVLFNRQRSDHNVMLFVPWCDQGLGIQARTYVKMFDHLGYQSHIFSFKPYFATPDNPKFQADPKEWQHSSIYYSNNDRETVTDEEIISFIKHRNIGHLMIPETCFPKVFHVASIAKSLGAKTYCIPNIEIVRKSELPLYTNFDYILCNNLLCQQIFNENGYMNTPYVNYTPIDNRLIFKRKNLNLTNRKIKFLALGGLNSILRKQILNVCIAFKLALERIDNIELHIGIQGSQIPKELVEYKNVPGFDIEIKHNSYADVIKKYQSADVNIQVSKHEGLGLGFYEAMATGTPSITLNTPPHNELVINNVNGWIIDCSYEDMKDNTDSFIKSALFDPSDLADKIVEIANNHAETIRIMRNVYTHFKTEYNLEKIANNFLDAMIL